MTQHQIRPGVAIDEDGNGYFDLRAILVSVDLQPTREALELLAGALNLALVDPGASKEILANVGPDPGEAERALQIAVVTLDATGPAVLEAMSRSERRTK